jgi:hypothetical protein
MADALAIYGNTSLLDGYRLPISVASDFLSGSAFDAFQKYQKSLTALDEAVVDRLNGVIRGINNLIRRS